MTTELILTGVSQGLILIFVAYGIMIPFRFLNFPDLSSEGAYPLAGAVYASLIFVGTPIPVAIIASMISSGMMLVCTGVIHLKLKVNTLLSGIILSTMAYSINLRIIGKPNIALFDFNSMLSLNHYYNIVIMIFLLLLCVIPLVLFLYTDFGVKFRSIGMNKEFAIKQGIKVNKYTLLGMFISGSFIGLAGSLVVQMQNYMDIGMGLGIAMHGLASLMIGEAIAGNHSLPRQLLAPIIGSLLYQQIQGVALSVGLTTSDLKLFTGMLILAVIVIRGRS